MTSEEAQILVAACEQHDPTMEPYASMTREQLLEIMEGETSPARRAMLEQFVLDTFSQKELETHNRAQELACFLIKQWEAFGNDQCAYLCGLAGDLAVKISEGLPPIGPAQECN